MNLPRLWARPGARSKSLPCVVAAAAAAMFFGATATEAAPAVSNLGNFHNGNYGIAEEKPYTLGRAQSFTTGNGRFRLQAATLAMDSTGAFGPGGFKVSLYSRDGEGLPGEELLALDGSDSPLNAENYTYAALSSFELEPNTTYWIVAELPPAGPDAAYYWTFSVNQSEIGLPGWSMGTSAISQSFMGWEPTWSINTMPLRMAIDVEAVPEPSTALSLICAAGAVLSARRFRLLSQCDRR